MESLLGAKIVSINYPHQDENGIKCTEVIVETEGETYSISPHVSSCPELSGPINLIFTHKSNERDEE